jgi:P27 family predicted phage terminase small subunit
MKKISPPKHLSRESRAWWRKLAEDYGIDDAGGQTLLTSAAECLDRLREAQAQIQTDGPMVTDRFGQQKAHPLLSVERDARIGLLSAMRDLHLDLEPLHPGPGRPPGR